MAVFEHAGELLDWRRLRKGNERQTAAAEIVQHLDFAQLQAAEQPFAVVGTIPIDIALETSDIDVLLEASDLDSLAEQLRQAYGTAPRFELHRKQARGRPSLVTRFVCRDELVELFAQDVPVTKQMGFLHMVAEWKILSNRGPAFRREVIELKRSGMKTEPAFASLLGLPGDPYIALLEFAREVSSDGRS